jgi:hypothetical protein
MDDRWDSRNTTLNGLKPLAQRVSYPIQPHARLHFRSACSPPTQFVSARTSTSHTSPPSRSSEVRLTRRRAIRTHTANIMENRNRTSCMYLCPRLFAQGNCPHSAHLTQPAVASRRCPPSWPPHERPWPELRVADTRRWRPQSAQAARCMHAKRTAARHAQPPTWSQNPPRRPTHTHAQGRALVVDHCCS